MQDIKEFYILCEPIDTRIGKLHFLKVNQFIDISMYSNLLILDKSDILPYINSDYMNYFKDMPFVEIIKYFNKEPYDLYSSYKKLFEICFKEDVFDKIEDDKELEYCFEINQKNKLFTYRKEKS